MAATSGQPLVFPSRDRRDGAQPGPANAGGASGLVLAGAVIGVSLGGFFDGILLHQILQWHHLLSLVPGEALRDLRNQVIADGAFHVLMYVIAAVGLWLLWRARRGLAADGAGLGLGGSVLLGFGIWQFVDVAVFHWIVGIHRIRVDVPEPLSWDIGWIVVFGVPTAAAGAWLLRRAKAGGGGTGGGARTGAVALALAVLASGPIAALPPALPVGAERAVLVLFRPGIGAPAAFAAVGAIDGRVAWADASGELLAVVPGEGADARTLYRHGAIVVSGASGLATCLVWTRTDRPERAPERRA